MLVCQIRAGRDCVREGEDCLKYLKRGWNRKEGKGNKDLKKGGQLGQGVGALKMGRGAGTLLQTIFVCVKHIEDVKMCEQALT